MFRESEDLQDFKNNKKTTKFFFFQHFKKPATHYMLANVNLCPFKNLSDSDLISILALLIYLV